VPDPLPDGVGLADGDDEADVLARGELLAGAGVGVGVGVGVSISGPAEGRAYPAGAWLPGASAPVTVTTLPGGSSPAG